MFECGGMVGRIGLEEKGYVGEMEGRVFGECVDGIEEGIGV